MPTIAGPAPPRLHAGIDPRLLRADRRREEGKRHRRRAARAQRARGPEPPRAARPRRAAPAEGRARPTTRKTRSRRSTSSTTRKTHRPARERCRSRASCTSNATIFARIRRRSSSAWRRGAKSGSAARISSPATRSSRTRAARSSSFAARTIRRRAAETRPTAAASKATLHWVSARHAIGGEVRLYDRLFSTEDPERAPDSETFLDHLNPTSLEMLRDCRLEPGLALARPGDRFQFERLGYFCRRSRFGARRAGIQPHGFSARRVGENRAAECGLRSFSRRR